MNTQPKIQSKKRFRWLWAMIVGLPALIGLSVALPYLAWILVYVLAAGFHYIFPSRVPEYDGMIVRNREDRLHILSIGDDGSLPAKLYLRSNEKTVQVGEISLTELESLGFKREFERLYVRGEEVVDVAEVVRGQLKGLAINSKDLGFSPNPDGPFLHIGCSFADFQKVFGKPKRWRAERQSWEWR